jgi:hypothetical protein
MLHHRAVSCRIDLLCEAVTLDAIREVSAARVRVAAYNRYAAQRELIASQIQHALPMEHSYQRQRPQGSALRCVGVCNCEFLRHLP